MSAILARQQEYDVEVRHRQQFRLALRLESKGLVAAVEKQLNATGWLKGRNLEIDYRWGAIDPERFASCLRRYRI